MSDLQKKCNGCKVWKSVAKFHKRGKNRDGTPRYSSKCADCENEIERQRWHDGKKKKEKQAHHKAYLRARSRALGKLARLHPEVYAVVLREECKKEGIFDQVDWSKVGPTGNDRRGVGSNDYRKRRPRNNGS